jgi:hypothetical protein
MEPDNNIAVIAVLCVIIFLALGVAFGFIPIFAKSPSDGGASTESARSVLSTKVGSESKGEISLDDFQKTDGQKGQIAGVEVYKLSFRARIRFRSEGTWISGDAMNPEMLTFRFGPSQQGSGALADFQNSIIGGKSVHPFSRATIDGVILGEKSENGWNYSVSSCRLVE